MSANATLLIARLMMAVLFFVSGVPKLLGHPEERKAIADLGLPLAGLLERMVGLALVAGAAMLAFGLWTRLAAASLAAFVVVVTPLFLRFWSVESPDLRLKLVQAFVANIGITGGLLAFAAVGPGNLAISPAT